MANAATWWPVRDSLPEARADDGMRAMCACHGVLSRFSCVRFFATLWNVAPPGSSCPHGILWARILRSGLSRPLPGDLPSDPGIEPTFLPSPALTGGLFSTSATSEALSLSCAWWENRLPLAVGSPRRQLASSDLR